VNQLAREFAPLEYDEAAANALTLFEPAPRTLSGLRDLLSVALQYGNAFLRGQQAAALKPADSFGNDDVLYLMEDMATGEIRLSIAWEWLHKQARLDDGTQLTAASCAQLLEEEYQKLLAASDRDVHDISKTSTLPIAREIVQRYLQSTSKPPWYIDLLNLNLDRDDLARAKERIERYLQAFASDATRLTSNQDFERD
jgi:malate synthase